MTNDNESEDARRLAGCGVIILGVLTIVVLAFIAALLYILFNFGALLGDM